MLNKLSNKLRFITIVLVATYVAASLVDEKEEEKQSDGFQGEKFDDIW